MGEQEQVLQGDRNLSIIRYHSHGFRILDSNPVSRYYLI